MLCPEKDEFKRLATRGNLVPVYREILADLDTPVSAFMKLGESPAFLLESVEGGEQWARYSFLGVRPAKTFTGRGRHMVITGREGSDEHELADPIEFLREVMRRYRPVALEGLPRFFGGLVGYLGYDTVRFIEELPDMAAPGLDVPDIFLMLMDTILVFDNLRQTIKVVALADLTEGDPLQAYDNAARCIEDLTQRLRTSVDMAEVEPSDSPRQREFTSAFGERAAFEAAVARAKDYVYSGDVVQVVLSQRFERPTTAAPFDIYRALRVINPSPYMYYLDVGEAQVVGSSPEILVRQEEDHVTVRPIAGTRKRGERADEDKALQEDLKRDPKEIAEHIMLVDLGRNDVGRVARTGTVQVSDLMTIESYSHVMHMVSNVTGRLAEGLDSFDVLRACFPAGTVSGAPKVRAMEIIEELEPVRRGPYAGAVGYFSFSGNMDTCITIRTLIVKDGTVSVQAGAGIVADSIPEQEYMETLNKARGMMKAVDMAEKGLT